MIESETREDEKQYAGKGGQKAGLDDAAPRGAHQVKAQVNMLSARSLDCTGKAQEGVPPEALLRELLV